jgi:hypothetical protein
MSEERLLQQVDIFLDVLVSSGAEVGLAPELVFGELARRA